MITFEDLQQIDEMKEVKLLSGEAGLGHPIRWLHLIYETEILSWIGQDVLVYTNGSSFHNPEKDLISVVQQIHTADASGLIIGIGRYINIVSKKVLQVSDQLHVPVFMMRDGSDAVALERKIQELCVRSDNRKNMSDRLEELIYETDPGRLSEGISSLGFQEGIRYIAVCFELDNIDESDDSWVIRRLPHRMFTEIRKAFQISEDAFLHYKNNKTCIVLLPVELCGGEKHIIQQLSLASEKMYQETGRTFSIGVSNVIKGSRMLSAGIYQAQCAVDSLHLCSRKNEIRCYEDMGVYRIFFQMKKDPELMKIYSSILGELQRQDTEEGELVETLRIYVESGCNLTKTADKLFIHRNTLKYRLNKIRNIIDADPDDPDQNFKIQLAYKIRKYLAGKNIKV